MWEPLSARFPGDAVAESVIIIIYVRNIFTFCNIFHFSSHVEKGQIASSDEEY